MRENARWLCLLQDWRENRTAAQQSPVRVRGLRRVIPLAVQTVSVKETGLSQNTGTFSPFALGCVTEMS
jgi:hypothetical protein